eukprot:7953898-Pyramimonas_sp.AAC.1
MRRRGAGPHIFMVSPSHARSRWQPLVEHGAWRGGAVYVTAPSAIRRGLRDAPSGRLGQVAPAPRAVSSRPAG